MGKEELILLSIEYWNYWHSHLRIFSLLFLLPAASPFLPPDCDKFDSPALDLAPDRPVVLSGLVRFLQGYILNGSLVCGNFFIQVIFLFRDYYLKNI